MNSVNHGTFANHLVAIGAIAFGIWGLTATVSSWGEPLAIAAERATISIAILPLAVTHVILTVSTRSSGLLLLIYILGYMLVPIAGWAYLGSFTKCDDVIGPLLFVSVVALPIFLGSRIASRINSHC